jgi:hypothetical protein
VVLLILLIPLFLVGIAVGIGRGGRADRNVVTITAAVVAAGGAGCAALCDGIRDDALGSFFQSYTLHFFSGRYPALAERLYPAAPPSPPPIPEPQPAA